MTRCIFRKPRRRLKLNQWLTVIAVFLGAALCLELQAESPPTQQTSEGSHLLGQLHHP